MLIAYVVAITAFGTWLGRRRRSVRDYFLGGRSVPWWAIASCIVATETSTLTFIGAPGTAYRGDWTFLQLVLGYVIGRLLIAALFIPAYFRGEIYTSYELLQKRFGGAVRGTSAAIFLLYRTLGDGIRLHAAALVLAVASGGQRWEWVWILVLGAAMILYTEEGGVTATIWTDTIQMFVYLAGAIVCLVVSVLLGESHAIPVTMSAWLPILYLTVAGSLGAFVLFSWLVTHWSVSNASLLGVTVPIIAVILGGLVKGEQPAALTYVGAAVVISAILIALRAPHARAVPAPAATATD